MFRSPVNGNTALQTEVLFWKSVKDSRGPKTFAAYLETYPNGTVAGLARVFMSNLIREAKPENTARRQQLASLQSPKTEKTPVARRPQYSVRQRTLVLQWELKRVGCDPGRVDGSWGSKGRRALSRFKRYARLDLDFDDLSDEVIDAVKQQRSNLCPVLKRVQKRRTQSVVSSQGVVKAKPKPQRTYGAQNRTKREWQDCVIESITPSPTTSGADC